MSGEFEGSSVSGRFHAGRIQRHAAERRAAAARVRLHEALQISGSVARVAAVERWVHAATHISPPLFATTKRQGAAAKALLHARVTGLPLAAKTYASDMRLRPMALLSAARKLHGGRIPPAEIPLRAVALRSCDQDAARAEPVVRLAESLLSAGPPHRQRQDPLVVAACTVAFSLEILGSVGIADSELRSLARHCVLKVARAVPVCEKRLGLYTQRLRRHFTNLAVKTLPWGNLIHKRTVARSILDLLDGLKLRSIRAPME